MPVRVIDGRYSVVPALSTSHQQDQALWVEKTEEDGEASGGRHEGAMNAVVR